MFFNKFNMLFIISIKNLRIHSGENYLKISKNLWRKNKKKTFMLCSDISYEEREREFLPKSRIFAFDKSSRPIVRINQLLGVHSFICVPTYRVFELHKSACGGFLSKMHRMSLLKLGKGKPCTWLCRDFSVEF